MKKKKSTGISGEKDFNYSYCMDKFGTVCKNEVPTEILDDYLATRKRNFEINKIYLQWSDLFDTLVFQKMTVQNSGLTFRRQKSLKSLVDLLKQALMKFL